ncbi:Lipoprotein, partial [Dysosmobacter welbionis]
ALLPGGEHCTGRRAGLFAGGGAVDLEPLPCQIAGRAGPGNQSPDLTVDLPGGAGPVDGGHLFCQHGGVGLTALILGCPGGCAVSDGRHRLAEGLCPQVRQAHRQGLGVLVRADGSLLLQDHVPCVQLLRHIHDGDAGSLLPVQDGPVDGGRPPILGQQRRVDVDRAVSGHLQNVLRQDAAVGRHHRQLRCQGLH